MKAKELLRLPSPILLCVDRADFGKAIEEAGYQTVSLNLPLAKSLAGLSESDIQSVIGERVHETLPTSQRAKTNRSCVLSFADSMRVQW
jgi:hypothetical protein